MWPIQWRVFFFLHLFLFIPLIVKWRECMWVWVFSQRGTHHLKAIFPALSLLPGFKLWALLFWELQANCSTSQLFSFFSFLSSAGPRNETQTTASCSKMCNFICRKWKQIHSPNKNQMLIKKPDIVHFCTTRFQRWKKMEHNWRVNKSFNSQDKTQWKHHFVFKSRSGTVFLESQQCFGVRALQSWFVCCAWLTSRHAECLTGLGNVTAWNTWSFLAVNEHEGEYDVECGGSGVSVRRPKALQQFRRGEGEIDELLLVDGRDQRFVDWREGGLFLSEVRVKVVHVFRRFLGTTDRRKKGSEWATWGCVLGTGLFKSQHKMVLLRDFIITYWHLLTYNPGLERRFQFSKI